MEHRNKKYKYAIGAVFILYIMMLCKIILFKNYSPIQLISGYTMGGFRSANLIPFKTIGDFTSMLPSDFMWAFSNIVGNIGVFIPLGYLLPMISKNLNNLKKVFLISFSLSLIFEIVQYLGYLGTTDVDDIILNTIGGVLGYLIYSKIRNILVEPTKIYKVSLVLGSICFIIAFTIAKEQFGDILGLNNHEVTTIGDEDIPKVAHDIRGTLVKLNDKQIKIYEGSQLDNMSKEETSDEISLDIDDNAKIYFKTIDEENENKTILTYKELTEKELHEVEMDSTVDIWMSDENNDLIDIMVIQEKLDLSDIGDIVGSESSTIVDVESSKNQSNKEEISGILEEIKEDIIVVNKISSIELEDKTSIGVTGRDEYANLIDIIITDDTEFILNTTKSNGEIIDSEISSKEELTIDDSIKVDVLNKSNKVIASKIEINKVVN